MEKNNPEILLEDIRGKFDLVLEGHDLLQKEIRDTRTELVEKISLVDFKVDALSARVEAGEAKLNNRIDAVETKFTAVEMKLTNRIDSVEAILTTKIDAVAADLKAHRAVTEAHHSVFRVKE